MDQLVREHKIARGYVPTLTTSAHHLPHEGFRGVVERFLEQERQEVAYSLDVLRKEASPFKHPPPPLSMSG